MSKKLIIVEGVMDRAVFETLLVKTGRATQEGRKARPWDPMKMKEFQIIVGKNKSGAIAQANISSAGEFKRVFLAVDLNSDSEKELIDYVIKEAPNLGEPDENGHFSNGNTRTTIIPLGLQDLKNDWEIEKFAIDDYLMKLILEKQVFDGLKAQAERHGPKINIDHDKAVHKLNEIKALMANQGFPVKLSEAYLEFFKGITGYVVTPATFAERIINNCPDMDILEKTFQDILHPLD